MGFDLDAVPAAIEDRSVLDASATTMGDIGDAIGCIAAVLAEGNAKGLGRQWRMLSPEEHVTRAVRHVLEWQRGHDPEDIDHALTRLSLAVQLHCEARRGPMPGALGEIGEFPDLETHSESPRVSPLGAAAGAGNPSTSSTAASAASAITQRDNERNDQ